MMIREVSPDHAVGCLPGGRGACGAPSRAQRAVAQLDLRDDPESQQHTSLRQQTSDPVRE